MYIHKNAIAACIVAAAFLTAAAPCHLAAQMPAAQPTQDSITITQPLWGGDTSLPIGPGISIWLTYFEKSAPWLYQVAVGICIIWVLLGGYMIMTSGGKDDRRSSGQQKIVQAIIGLLLLSFSGFVLRTINNLFFV
ncbi:hypothetical protein GX553_02490 [Candidatus Peribacteria bacterium]|nr:hypothetical protein [Candidatus Peribacteria bacterium]